MGFKEERQCIKMKEMRYGNGGKVEFNEEIKCMILRKGGRRARVKKWRNVWI